MLLRRPRSLRFRLSRLLTVKKLWMKWFDYANKGRSHWREKLENKLSKRWRRERYQQLTWEGLTERSWRCRGIGMTSGDEDWGKWKDQMRWAVRGSDEIGSHQSGGMAVWRVVRGLRLMCLRVERWGIEFENERWKRGRKQRARRSGREKEKEENRMTHKKHRAVTGTVTGNSNTPSDWWGLKLRDWKIWIDFLSEIEYGGFWGCFGESIG